MNTIKITNIFILFAFCIFQSNNLFSITRYKAQPLDSLQHKLQNNEIGFEYKFFNKRDCKKYLGRRRILSKGYVPVQISITNNTDQSFKFSPYNTTLSNVSYYNVAKKVYFSRAGSFFKWILPHIFFIVPISLLTIFCISIGNASGPQEFSKGNITGITISSIALVSLPSIAAAENIKISQANKQLLTDYEHKTLKDSIIKPYSTINGMLFINKKEYNHEFSLTVTNISNNEQHTLSTENQYIIPKKTIEPISKLVPDFTQKILSYVPLPAFFTF